MRLNDALEDATERLTRLSMRFPKLLFAMRDAMSGQPMAQHYDVLGSGRSEVWCWHHERPLDRCHEADKLDCTGEAFVVQDPTGEAAVNFDRARNDHRQLSRDIRTLAMVVDRIELLHMRYMDARVVNDRAGIGACTDCHRYCDGSVNNRLSVYKGGDPVCHSCRVRRDRSESKTA